jgi:hypothetical protein
MKPGRLIEGLGHFDIRHGEQHDLEFQIHACFAPLAHVG